MIAACHLGHAGPVPYLSTKALSRKSRCANILSGVKIRVGGRLVQRRATLALKGPARGTFLRLGYFARFSHAKAIDREY